MSYSSELTRERILECAEKEFLEMGFLGANLRKIAQEAKVTTGALYTHFKNKAELFDALVKEPADGLVQSITAFQNQAVTEIPPQDAHTFQVSENATDHTLSYIYEHFNAFKLILCSAEGTVYIDYIDRLAAIEEKRIIEGVALLGLESSIDDFFIHVMCATGYQELFEVVMHELPKEEAVAYLAKTKQFRYAGWRAVMSP